MAHEISYTGDVQVIAQSWTANHVQIANYRIDVDQQTALVEARVGSLDAGGNFAIQGIYRFSLDLSAHAAELDTLTQQVAQLAVNQGKLPAGGTVS